MAEARFRPKMASLSSLFLFSVLLSTEAIEEVGGNAPDYGVDVSFPMHHSKVSTNFAWLPHNVDSSVPTPSKYQDMVVQPLGDRQKFYDDFMDSCVKAYGTKGKRCYGTEQDRIDMTLRQPQSMQNYTENGFKKIKAPKKLFDELKKFWEANKHQQSKEMWGAANTYTNNWNVPTWMVSVENKGLRGAGPGLKQRVWDAAKTIIQEWTGQELTQCSLYGIRVYKDGAILAPHVDRLPLVSSAIIQVAQDVQEPWPLEVIGHDGRAHNVTMEPGDMVLYESHSVIHGRPFPLKGWVANIFVHFEPTGHSLRHNMKLEGDGHKDVHARYEDALKRAVGGHENDNHGLPAYVLPNSPEEPHWRRQHPGGIKNVKRARSFTTGSTNAHQAAQFGNIDTLKKAVTKDKKVVHARDENGWTPLHEGARGGHLDIVRYLTDSGADVNAKARDGATALYWAKQSFDEGHPVIDFLESLGAIEAGPDL